ncbi:integral peroxisomal membrane peroxin-domain-containing protein [Pholiota molesta]|nr:integral peroxisomal membrane peroxin-domain-containing protein [Pholiota molesta]
MATMDYVDVPPGAIRLRKPPKSTAKDDGASTELRPLPKIVTALPHPSPPPSPTSFRRKSLLAATAESLASPTLSLIPQLLLSSMLPDAATHPCTSAPRTKGEVVLLSTKDPLSLPIMSVNFKRFVTIVGPVFWLQDRVEEILLWKRGWMRTAVWMCAYAFLCFYPRLLLLLPHIALISIILSTYPYPNSTSDQQTPNVPPTEGSVPWQANIQGIQNLMGMTADLHDLVQPYLYHLYLTPDIVSPTSARQSPYTPHILTVLVLSFFPLLFIINLPHFPIREVCLVIGLAPFIATHPATQRVFPVILHAAAKSAPLVLLRLQEFRDKATSALRRGKAELEEAKQPKKEPPLPFSTVLQRIMDDDRLSDACWNAEMREVQLWENERWGGPLPTDSPTMAATSSSSSISPPQKGWSKQNLRPGERTGWTRGRDGWNGGGPGGSGNIAEGSGEVSSNLTFSLAPGWAFVETEDWRKDVQCAWSGCGGDPDGWVYTNDAWIGARPAPYTAGGGSVTRRRRWVRRVWYDPKRATADT